MTREEEFKPYLEQIKALGYRVYVNPDAHNGITYCVIADNQGNIGYCQLEYFGLGVQFATIHKPSRDAGTGFAVTDWDQPIFNIERKHVESCLAFTPEWVNNRERKFVKKWTLNEYLNSFWGKCYIEYESEK